MKKFTKSALTVSVLAASVLGSTAAVAEVSMNIGATSNYLWRGWTQSGDEAAISGGLDFADESGIYAGTWTSSLGGGEYELDLYVGYATEFSSGVGIDVGYVNYRYPNADVDFSEVYLGGSYQMFSAKVSYDSDNEDMYIEAGLDFELSEDIGLGLHVGSYDFDVAEDYTDYSVTVSKGDVALTYSDMSENLIYNGTDNARVAVSWGTSF